MAGEAGAVNTAVTLLSELIDVARTGTPLDADAVERAIGLLNVDQRPAQVFTDDILTARGRTIRPKTLGQSSTPTPLTAPPSPLVLARPVPVKPTWLWPRRWMRCVVGKFHALSSRARL